jgi:hypothetical protein
MEELVRVELCDSLKGYADNRKKFYFLVQSLRGILVELSHELTDGILQCKKEGCLPSGIRIYIGNTRIIDLDTVPLQSDCIRIALAPVPCSRDAMGPCPPQLRARVNASVPKRAETRG